MNYRAYHFGNYYLSGIQQGIQAAHAQTAMINKYVMRKLCNVCNGHTRESLMNDIYIDAINQWIKQPTMICLNGGNNEDLCNTFDLFDTISRFPYASFHEDHESLDGILTNVVILLPEYIYDAHRILVCDAKYKDEHGYTYTAKSISELMGNNSLMKIVEQYCRDRNIPMLTQADINIIEHVSKHRLA